MFCIVFAKFGAANKAVLFGIPRSEKYSSKRLPALLEELSVAFDYLMYSCSSGIRIGGSVNLRENTSLDEAASLAAAESSERTQASRWLPMMTTSSLIWPSMRA